MTGRADAWRRRLPVLVTAAVLGSLAWAAAGPIWHLAGHDAVLPADPGPARAAQAPTGPAPDLSVIAALNPFGAPPPPEPAAPTEETALDLTLHGVLLSPEPARSIALIAESGPARPVRPGETVADGRATLLEVASGHVVLSVDGRRETLSFKGAEPPEPGETAAPEAAAPESGPGRLRALIAAARAREPAPDTVEGWIALWRERIRRNPVAAATSIGLTPTPEGYRVEAEHGGVLAQAGLRPGDVVRRVNGRDLGDPDRDRAHFDAVVAEGQVRVEVERNGGTIVLTAPLR